MSRLRYEYGLPGESRSHAHGHEEEEEHHEEGEEHEEEHEEHHDEEEAAGNVTLDLDQTRIGDEEQRLHTSIAKDNAPAPGRTLEIGGRATFWRQAARHHIDSCAAVGDCPGGEGVDERE